MIPQDDRNRAVSRRTLLATAGAAAAFPLAATGPSPAAASTAASARLAEVIERITREQIMTSPESLTSLGLDRDGNAGARFLLDDRSPARMEADRALFRAGIEDLGRIDRSALSGVDAVNHDTLTFFGGTALTAFAFPYGSGFSATPYAVSHMSGTHQSIPDFLNAQHRIETAEDADAYLSRLDRYAVALDQDRERMQAEFAAGATPPDFILAKTLQLMAAQLATPAAQSGLVRSIAARTAARGLTGDWAARAERTVTEAVYPALTRLSETMRAAQAGAVHDAGVWRLPDGDRYYDHGLRSYTTTALTGDEIHRMGVDQVADLTGRADALLKAQGLTQGTVAERFRGMNFDPSYQYPNTDEGRAQLLADLNAQMADMQARLPQYFGRLPRAPVEIRRVPEATQAAAPGGYYQAPSLDGSRPGAYYINLANTGAWAKWKLPTLTYHEASPGHHHQTTLQQERAEAPLLMKMMLFSGYSEGWGLYAEQLADEMGVYANDPFGRLGYYQSLLFRAARMVVDSGIHSKRWSREQAGQYMMETIGGAAWNEIDRYCVLPGQACSYKVGHTEWVRLREKARTRLGAAFDIRAFHDAGMDAGGVPLAVLERVLDDWSAGVARG